MIDQVAAVQWAIEEGACASMVSPGHVLANPEQLQRLIDRAIDFGKAQAEQQVAGTEHEFKNFHRSLCERFGYVHDEIDWKRDQVSLEEWIARSKRDPECEAAEPSEDAKRTLANPPERIYLQVGDVESEYPGEISWRDVSWCAEQVQRSDLVYVREDLKQA